jgi:uncharacterized membrane protein HdeD (DUF308 family)
MPRGRTVVLLWIALPALWIAIGVLAVTRGAYIHGVWLATWLLGAAVMTVGLAVITLWWWIRRRQRAR